MTVKTKAEHYRKNWEKLFDATELLLKAKDQLEKIEVNEELYELDTAPDFAELNLTIMSLMEYSNEILAECIKLETSVIFEKSNRKLQ